MAINYWQLMGSLRMGIDLVPMTDWRDVPHAVDPCHVPVYRMQVEGEGVRFGSVDVLVNTAHTLPVCCTIYEDDYPVMEIC